MTECRLNFWERWPVADVHFDGIAENFGAAVYGTSKGYVRLGVLWEDLCEAVPAIQTGKLRVLDVGGGMGQVATRLAGLGHSVVLADPSQDMLDKAREAIQRDSLEGSVATVRSSVQNLAQHVSGSFDLVMCHAVLEWVASPDEFIRDLSAFVGPGSQLSLMFYNQNAAVLKTVLRGDFETFPDVETVRKAELSPPTNDETSALSGARGLTIPSVTQLLNKRGLAVTSKAGIRIFHDHIPDLKQDRLTALLALEKNYRKVEPFASLAQHVHLVCCRY